MTTILPLPRRVDCDLTREDMFRMQRIVSDKLDPLVRDGTSYPFDVFRATEELVSFLDPSLSCVVREWTDYEALSPLDVQALYDALRSRNAHESASQVRLLARKVGVIR